MLCLFASIHCLFRSQLAVVLLVLFIAYALQVRYRPYMSPEERKDVIRDHIYQSLQGGVHSDLALRLKAAEAHGKKAARIMGMSAGAGTGSFAFVAAAAVLGYFFNYNTVEMVLLFCCCLVALSGIMFESGRYQSGAFTSQKNAIAAFVIFVIIVSIVYCTCTHAVVVVRLLMSVWKQCIPSACVGFGNPYLIMRPFVSPVQSRRW